MDLNIPTALKAIKRIISGLASRWRNIYYRALGVKLNGYVWLRAIEIPRNYADIAIEANCALDRGVTLLCSGESSLQPKISIGADTYINRYSLIDANRLGQDWTRLRESLLTAILPTTIMV